jgi:23S rRNA (adenine2503-C2)-methyltransferase
MILKQFESSEGNVWKYVFDFDGAIAEAVLYRYESFEKRTVLCVSVMSGCPCDCQMCGTGNHFIRNLTEEEIVQQVDLVLEDKNIDPYECDKFQIMFMSMGEPFLNYQSVRGAIRDLYIRYSNVKLLVSTIAPNMYREMADFMVLSGDIENIGLQFSIHATTDEARSKLIPYRNKLSLREIRDYGIEWWNYTGAMPYLNYCITDSFALDDVERLKDLFPPNVFCFTFSVLCSPDENMKQAGYRDLTNIRYVESLFSNEYSTRVFDPAGQDDIGGGCGQLWYVQQALGRTAE